MAKPKSDKIYKVTCVATGKVATVRPEVWKKRVERYQTDPGTLIRNYLCRDAIRSIKSGGDPKENLKNLCAASNQPEVNINDQLWDKYMNGTWFDEDVEQIKKEPNEFPYTVAEFEVVNADIKYTTK